MGLAMAFPQLRKAIHPFPCILFMAYIHPRGVGLDQNPPYHRDIRDIHIWDIHRLHTYTYSNDYNSLHIDTKANLLIYSRRETKLGRERYMIISK